MAATVYSTPFSIGYVEQAYSKGLLVPFAAIRNHAGNYVTPSTQTVTADAAQKPGITPADFSIVNQPGASSYPINRSRAGGGALRRLGGCCLARPGGQCCARLVADACAGLAVAAVAIKEGRDACGEVAAAEPERPPNWVVRYV